VICSLEWRPSSPSRTSCRRGSRDVPFIAAEKATHPDLETTLLASRSGIELVALEDRLGRCGRAPSQLHGRTLDDLVGLVETRYFLTIDSDMLFKARGWLEAMVGFAESPWLGTGWENTRDNRFVR
jgi:hypothetical protein